MSSNVNHGIIAAIIGFVLILLGWQGCSNNDFDGTACGLLALGIAFLIGGLVEIEKGMGPQENSDILQEDKEQNDRR